jgi:hypothetical protein
MVIARPGPIALLLPPLFIVAVPAMDVLSELETRINTLGELAIRHALAIKELVRKRDELVRRFEEQQREVQERFVKRKEQLSLNISNGYKEIQSRQQERMCQLEQEHADEERTLENLELESRRTAAEAARERRLLEDEWHTMLAQVPLFYLNLLVRTR